MITEILEIDVARLDGYLAAIAALNGSIREYSAGAYAVEAGRDDAPIEQSIRSFYSWLPDLDFSDVRRLEQGLRDLELEVEPFLVRSVSRTSFVDLDDLRRYVAFRVMDLVGVIVDRFASKQVFKVTSAPRSGESQCVYFCIRTEGPVIVLQFNDDAEFVKAGMCKAAP